MNNDEEQYKKLTIKRTFDAPLEVVWQAWTNPEQFAKWWSPDGFTVPVCELDVKAGGVFHVEMEGPDGTLYPTIGQFREVSEPKQLSFTNTPMDNNGKKLFEVLQTVRFSANGDKTEIEVVSEVLSATPQAAPYLAGMESGLNQALGKLARAVGGQ